MTEQPIASPLVCYVSAFATKCSIHTTANQVTLSKKKKEKKLRDVTTYLPRPPTLRYPTKDVMWGGVSDVVNHAKFHQTRFGGIGCLMGRNLPFSYA